MNSKYFLPLILATAVIFPFVADHMGWWAAALGTGQTSTVVLTIYTVSLIVIFVLLLLRSTVIPKKEKIIWGVCMALAFPLVALALLYRLYWYTAKTPANTTD